MIVSIITGVLIAGVIIHNTLSHDEVSIEDDMKRKHIRKYCRDYVNNIYNNPDEYVKYLFYWNNNKEQIKQIYCVSSFEYWISDLALRSYVEEYGNIFDK